MEENGLKRDEKGRFIKGTIGGPGRPPGKTLKEWARERLMSMTEEERNEWIIGLPKEILWRMAEGNPHNTEDITSKGEKIIPIYASSSIQGHDGDAPSVPNEEKN